MKVPNLTLQELVTDVSRLEGPSSVRSVSCPMKTFALYRFFFDCFAFAHSPAMLVRTLPLEFVRYLWGLPRGHTAETGTVIRR